MLNYLWSALKFLSSVHLLGYRKWSFSLVWGLMNVELFIPLLTEQKSGSSSENLSCLGTLNLLSPGLIVLIFGSRLKSINLLYVRYIFLFNEKYNLFYFQLVSSFSWDWSLYLISWLFFLKSSFIFLTIGLILSTLLWSSSICIILFW